MSSNPEDAPPPPYTSSATQPSTSSPSQPPSNSRPSIFSQSPPDSKLTLQTASGPIPVVARLHIFNDPGLLPENRQLYIRLSDSDPKSRAYHVEFPSKHATAMYVHRGNRLGPIIGQASFPKKEYHVAITFPDGEEIQIEDVDPNIGRAAFQLPLNSGERTFYWASTEKYEHEFKGKSRGMETVGDVELRDETGKVYGVFLNEWKAPGSKDRENVGRLDLFEVEDEKLVDQWVVTLLALVEKYVLGGKLHYGKLAGGVAAGAVALCVVS